ncbi:MAG TPA: heavy-metal-associated domain-containing protein [Kiritimatiellia bacterium]|nr:heavy-metal-associated domain-containing protein [Kiritimatiellia bacterium]
MTTPECFNILSGRVRGVEAVQDVKVDYATQTVFVQFDGLKAALKNIEFAIAAAGFDVNDTPAAAAVKAALPEGCR